MGLYFPCVLAFLTVLVAASHAVLSPELYWKSALPNAPMPKAISDLLQLDFMDEKSTSVGVGKGGVNVKTNKGKSGGTRVVVGKGGVGVNTKKGNSGGTHVSVGKGSGVNVNTGKPGKGTRVTVGKGHGVGVSTGSKGKPVHVGVGKGDPFNYNYAASKSQLLNDPNVALFFLEKDIHKGANMNLRFVKTSNGAAFLPRQIVEPIPFSSAKLPEILTTFSVMPQSDEAEMMKETIEKCESPSVKGEEKYCPTSLEAMVDFSASKLGKNMEAISTDVEKESGTQRYTVTKVVKKTDGEKSVVCHKQNYVYAVFYCHATQSTKTYMVSLEAMDGTKAKAVAVCHTDTSAWNPKHMAFQVLKVSPGTVPVCHFLPEDHIVWIPVTKSA